MILPRDKQEPVDWVKVCRTVIKQSEGQKGLEDIPEMTLAEIAFYVDDWDAPRPAPGISVCTSPQDVWASAQEFNRMTPQQRLQRMREERDHG